MDKEKETFREKGTVAAIEGGKLTIVIDSGEVDLERCISCGACASKEDAKTLTAAMPDGPVAVGDAVVLECTMKNVYLAIFLMFFVPLVGLGIGAAAGYCVPMLVPILKLWRTGVTVLSSVAGMVVAFIGVMIYSKYRIEPKHPAPKIIEVIKKV
ncbi:MAG: SoxR reducing system RseC family protein [Planctomycetota bacterium]|jgi:positive regulator of sigma E activity